MLPSLRFPSSGRKKTRKPQAAAEARASKRPSSSSPPREDTLGLRQQRPPFSCSAAAPSDRQDATEDREVVGLQTPRSMAFFNDPSSERFAASSAPPGMDTRRVLYLMRAFETRLWEVDVQVDSITCVCFGITGLPYSRVSSRYHELVSRLSQVRIMVMEQKKVGDYMPGVTLLVEVLEHDRVNLTIVKVATPRDLIEEIFDEPISDEELETVISFVCSFNQWCGRS